MFDLHNHVLPGVDDGPRDFPTALRMLEIAIGQGITHVACTSHANDRANIETDRLFQSVFLQLQSEVKSAGLPVQLTLAAEFMLGADILKVLELPFATYGNRRRYFLLEFPLETPFEIMVNVIKTVRQKNLTPVIAHFERFARGQRTEDQPAALRELGAVITMDAGSVGGQFGAVIAKRAKQLLKWNVVDILASDAHNDAEHGFCLKSGYESAAAIVGESAAHAMVVVHPRRVWEGQPWPSVSASRGVKSA